MSDQALHRGVVTGEFETSERCSVVELWNVAADNDVSVARCRVKPGVVTQLHSLAISERYVVEQGSGIMEVGKEVFRLDVGDAAQIAAEQPQRIFNDGECDLVFLAVCSPAFRSEHYRDLEASEQLPPPKLP